MYPLQFPTPQFFILPPPLSPPLSLGQIVWIDMHFLPIHIQADIHAGRWGPQTDDSYLLYSFPPPPQLQYTYNPSLKGCRQCCRYMYVGSSLMLQDPGPTFQVGPLPDPSFSTSIFVLLETGKLYIWI